MFLRNSEVPEEFRKGPEEFRKGPEEFKKQNI